MGRLTADDEKLLDEAQVRVSPLTPRIRAAVETILERHATDQHGEDDGR